MHDSRCDGIENSGRIGLGIPGSPLPGRYSFQFREVMDNQLCDLVFVAAIAVQKISPHLPSIHDFESDRVPFCFDAQFVYRTLRGIGGLARDAAGLPRSNHSWGVELEQKSECLEGGFNPDGTGRISSVTPIEQDRLLKHDERESPRAHFERKPPPGVAAPNGIAARYRMLRALSHSNFCMVASGRRRSFARDSRSLFSSSQFRVTVPTTTAWMPVKSSDTGTSRTTS